MSVILYSTPTCGWCQKTKEFLKENKIKFTSIDVSKNQKKAEEMIRKSGQRGVPVIDINNTIIIGFDEAKIKKALKI